MLKRPAPPLIPREQFLRRMARSTVLGGGLIAAALMIGVLGYHYIAGFVWIDSLLDASMILAGMGPVGTLTTNAGKIFASCYALFSGVMFLTSVGIVIAPAVHRFLHRFHLELEEKSD
jgi:hypothetical protein